MQARDRLIVAVDASSRDDILRIVDDVAGVAGVIKIGLQAFISNGPPIVRDVIARGERVFLDLKIHDIPNTAANAVAAAVALGASIVTVHAAGGESMLVAAASEQRDALVAGVTILTSLSEADLLQIGFGGAPLSIAVCLARLASDAGLRAVVASPHEIRAIRHECGEQVRIIAPGIRPAGSDAGDQRRTMTPRDAIAEGADYIVVGRPITGAKNRRDAATRILAEMAPLSS